MPRYLLSALALALAAPAALADPPAPGDPRGGITRLGAPAGATYPKRWALIVGVDQYRPPTKSLKNAVNDATAVKAKLEKYGFAGEHVVFLTDAQATRAKVMEVWDQVLCNPAKVGPDDCVLVFFSGHGVEKGKDTFLLPADAAFGDNGLTDSSAIDLADVRKRLVDRCPARHKLLILDSCHAGGVFRLDGDPVDPRRAPTDGSFAAPRVVQAIASARGTQEAQDGGPGRPNSPFTSALLAALESIPTKLNNRPGQYQFTTTTLFETLLSHLKEDPALSREARNQTPQCMWLDRDRQGEFHFFPVPGAAFERRVADEEVLLLAMTPTTFGNWWADEVPWFMPGLRYEILESRPANRSGLLGQLDRDQLRAAADAAARRLAGDTKDEGIRRRVAHLRLLFGETGEGGGKDKAIAAIAKELRAVVGPGGPTDEADPLDLHYLAVLDHKLGRAAEAEAGYLRALDRYRVLMQTQSRRYRPLYALCLADQATFELVVLRKYQDAANRFGDARREYAADSPAPFKVYTLYREAEAYRRLGYSGPSDAKLRKAEEAITNVDPEWKSPLAAATLKQFGWADMERWRFKAARDKFEAARTVLDPHVKKGDRDEYMVDLLHIDHGLAMIERFQGNPAKALQLYRELTPRIVATIEALDQERNLFNYAEVRQLLYARLVNSFQRQADCSLFAPVPDYPEAADDYRRAMLETDNLNEDVRDEQRVTLLYGQAIALGCESPAKDVERARSRFNYAEKVRLRMKAHPLHAEISRSIAYTLLFEDPAGGPPRDLASPLAAAVGAAATANGPADPPPPLLEKCRALRRENRALDRDELERLMFGYRLLIEARLSAPAPGPAGAPRVATVVGDRNDLLRMVDDLLRSCRLAARLEQPDPDLLRYLRPYYELAFRAKLAAAPVTADSGHPLVKELIEIAWEATQGTAYHKPAAGNPVLVLFCLRGQGCFLLDSPTLGGRCYLLNGMTPADLGEAVADRAPVLPLELLRDLRAVAATLGTRDGDRRLVLRWGDPCQALGYRDLTTAAPGVSLSTDARFVYELDTSRPFPFELRWAVAADRCLRCPLERSFRAHNPYRLPSTALSLPPTALPVVPMSIP